MHPWLISHFRVTLFSSQVKPVPESLADSMFSDLVGVEPETDEWRGNKTVHRRLGTVDPYRFELLEQPTRIDFTTLGPLNLDIAAIGPGVQVAALGDLTSLDRLIEPAEKMYRKCHDVIRVGFGALFYLPAESPEQGYNIIQDLIPGISISYDTISDFAMQINRFTTSEAKPDLRINRLCNIMVVSVGMLVGSGDPASSQKIPSAHFVQLAPDINTSPENRSPFAPETFKAICADLKKGLLYVAEGVR